MRDFTCHVLLNEDTTDGFKCIVFQDGQEAQDFQEKLNELGFITTCLIEAEYRYTE
jgi:hypothetical protein